MERKENSKIFKRKDNFYTPNGFAMENNDLKDFENNLEKNSPGDISVLF